MTYIRRHLKPIALAASCVAIGAGVSAIATAGAATPSTGTAATSSAVHHPRIFRRPLWRAVHGDIVVQTRAKRFATVTFDRGIVRSVSGQQLTFDEGTRVATYKTVTLTVPANARVWVNRRRASLSDVTRGQHVLVVQGAHRWYVVSRTLPAQG